MISRVTNFLELLRRSRPRVRVTPSIIQMEALECGPAALAIVLAYFGRWVALEELKVVCGVSRNGSKASTILRAARSYGLEARGSKLEPEMLRHISPPVVLHWNFSHFIVFEGFDRKGRGCINDPASGRRRISMAEMDDSMTGVALFFEPGPSFERKGEPPQLWRALRTRLEGTRSAVAFIFLVSLLLLIPGLLMPSLSRMFIDHVLLLRERVWAIPLLGAMTITLLLLAMLTLMQRRFLLRFQTHMAVGATGRFFWHLLRLPLEFFTQRFPGDISSRVSLNNSIAELLSGDLAVSLLSFLVLAFYAFVMVQYDVVLTLVSIAILVLNLIVLHWTSRRRADSNKRLLREENRLNGLALWGLETIENLKATSSEGDLFAHWAGQQAKIINIRQELEIVNQPLEVLSPFLMAINMAMVLAVGGLRVMQGRLSLGELVAFQILTVAFTAPVNRLVSLGRRLQIAEGEVGLLDDVLRAQPDVSEIETAQDLQLESASEKLQGNLELRDVTFGYSPMDQPVIRGIDLALNPGSCVAIVGETGSGKTTLAKLVVGLYKPWKGKILFDGQTTDELSRQVWTSSVAVVDQDIFVFEGTVRENLSLWNDKLPMEQLVAATRDACLIDEITVRPDHLNAPVAEGGTNWSGGQLQRMEIARALSICPTVLVLDEATSSLDPETEAQIIQNIRHRGCTCLVIAHRLSTIRDMDEIVVLKNGEIIQRGTHAELMSSGGPYVNLVMAE